MNTHDFPCPPIISVTTTHQDDVAVVCVAGEVDMSSVEPFETAVRSQLTAGPRGLVMDLVGVTFCGSSGLRILVEARVRAETTRTALCLVADGPAVLRTLEVSGLTPLFRVHTSVPDALTALAA
jgi:anti-sigma B factor antagonist